MNNFYQSSQQQKEFSIYRRIARRGVKNVLNLPENLYFFNHQAKQNPTHFHHIEHRPDWHANTQRLFLLDNYYFYRWHTAD
ncbi:MAG: hypothetical protein ACR2NY_01400 [Alphaproteobacteria bacterium]